MHGRVKLRIDEIADGAVSRDNLLVLTCSLHRGSHPSRAYRNSAERNAKIPSQVHHRIAKGKP